MRHFLVKGVMFTMLSGFLNLHIDHSINSIITSINYSTWRQLKKDGI